MGAPQTIPPLPASGAKFPPLPAALDAMKAEKRWVVWRWEPHPKSGKLTKVPYRADEPHAKAASNRPSTWCSFEVAVTAYAVGKAHGIGFTLAGSTFGMFDLDDCRDPKTGAIAVWARAQVDRSGSYAEVTTSGTGLRIIGRATGPKVHRNQAVLGSDGGRIETYRNCERYVVVTGDHLPGSPNHLGELDAEIDATVELLDLAGSGSRADTSAEDVEPAATRETPRRDLPPELMQLIECGTAGDRSKEFHHVVGWLKDYGWEVAEIVDLLARHPAGIGEKYANRLPEEVKRCWDKAKSKPRRPRSASPLEELVTEDSATIRFVELYADRLRFCHDHRAWFEWTGAAWRQNRVGIAFRWARELARELGRSLGDDPKAKAILGKTAFAAGVEKFARTDAAFALTQEAWDADLWLLGTPGGTIDLRTGELREPEPGDGITKLTAVAPAEIADCPLWLAFLDQATKSDPQMIRLLQQLAGIALTGETREHILPFAFGDGGNGKGVLINTLARILGDYAVTATMDTFMASHGDKHSTDLAMLRGARLVTASETEEGRAWAESRIKQMTGGDPITARFMRCDNFTYVPQFLLLIMGNNKPNLNSVDAAMRRRFIMLPFENKPPVVDPLLPQKLEAEWPGILRWMIEGCLDWQQNGLVRSERDKAATEEYFATQDAFGQWLAEECDCEPGNEFKTATSAELFSAWQMFARKMGDVPGTLKSFPDRLDKRGFIKKHRKVGSVWHGIRLRPQRPWQEAAE